MKTCPTFRNLVSELTATLKGQGITTRTHADPRLAGTPAVRVVISRVSEAVAMLSAAPTEPSMAAVPIYSSPSTAHILTTKLWLSNTLDRCGQPASRRHLVSIAVYAQLWGLGTLCREASAFTKPSLRTKASICCAGEMTKALKGVIIGVQRKYAPLVQHEKGPLGFNMLTKKVQVEFWDTMTW